MIGVNKRCKMMCVIILFIIVVPALVNATILFRDTFEGPGIQLEGWTINKSVGTIVERRSEDEENEYASQAHGDKSVIIYDPNDTSYANAYKTFTNSASEYMTEFYLWIYHTHAHIDSFPLCVLWNVPSGLGIAHRTDIALVLDTVITPPDDQIFIIRAQDNNGFHTACYLDTSDIDTWHKIQIYRKPLEAPLPAKVVLYFDGDSIGTYSPMNSNYKTNKISFGTTQADSLSDGEVFYDDVSFADCTDLRKQITQINQKEILSFLTEADHYFSSINPYIIYRNYVYFNPGDLYYVMSLSNSLNNTYEDLSNYERLSYFNELIVKIDQIKLGLLYGHLNEKEKKLVKQSTKFVDKNIEKDYNFVKQGGDR